MTLRMLFLLVMVVMVICGSITALAGAGLVLRGKDRFQRSIMSSVLLVSGLGAIALVAAQVIFSRNQAARLVVLAVGQIILSAVMLRAALYTLGLINGVKSGQENRLDR